MTQPTTLREVIAQRALEAPRQPYLIAADTGRTITHAMLARDCNAFGAALAAAGLAPGDIVSVFMPNGEQTTRLLLGLMANGLIANPVNLLCQPAQIRYILEHSDTRLVFTTPDKADAVRAALAALDRPVAVVETPADADTLPGCRAWRWRAPPPCPRPHPTMMRC